MSDTFQVRIDPNLENSRYSGAQITLSEIYNTLHREYLDQLQISQDEFKKRGLRPQEGNALDLLLSELNDKFEVVQKETARKLLLRLNDNKPKTFE